MAKSFDELVKRTMSPKARARAEARAYEILASLFLSEIREAMGVSQSQLAGILKIKQPSLSKLESQPDMHIATLRRIVEALGGELEIVAKFKGGAIRIEQFDEEAEKPERSRAGSVQMALISVNCSIRRRSPAMATSLFCCRIP